MLRRRRGGGRRMAAVDLGTSRQHVVDLCTRGVLPFTSTGTHRRIHRHDVEALSSVPLTREAERSLWLHRAVAGHLVGGPGAVLTTARENLARMQAVHASGMSAVWLSAWEVLLDAGVDAVLDTLTSRAPRPWSCDRTHRSPECCRRMSAAGSAQRSQRTGAATTPPEQPISRRTPGFDELAWVRADRWWRRGVRGSASGPSWPRGGLLGANLISSIGQRWGVST